MNIEILTTITEITGALLITAGIVLLLGVGAALIAAGVFTIAGSYLVAK
ncbi:MAG: hypothetical protein WCR20_04760 [Verrucomicrobiota bacterium]